MQDPTESESYEPSETFAWSEDRIIVLMYREDSTDREIADALVRHSLTAVTERRRQLGLSRGNIWTDEETQRLRQLFDEGVPDATIATILDKTERSVTLRRNRIGLTRYSRNTRPHRADSSEVVETLRKGIDAALAMLRAHRSSGVYSIRDIEEELQEALASSSSTRAPVP